MSSAPTGRDLTPGETGCVGLLKMFDEACNKRQLTVTVVGTKKAADVVYKLETQMKICRALKVDYMPSEEKYRVVFALTEFRKYMEFMLTQVGLTLLPDGSLQTYDKLVVSNEYLGKE